MTFTLQVWSPIRHGHQGIALYDSERRLVWASSSDDLTLIPGIHELNYAFPFLPSLPEIV